MFYMARPCWRLEAGHENGVREMAPDGKCTDTGAKKSFAAAIDTIALEGMEREQAISFGRKKALEYSWRRTAESTALFLRTLTESAGSPSC